MSHHVFDDMPSGKRRRAMLHAPTSFLRREDGSTTVFATVVFVLMVGVGGIAVDLMRYETQRVQLQYTLDRAVLAAASMSQSLDAVSVVENYFETSGLEGYRLRVNVEEGLNFRRVEARAEMEVQTLFMSIFGQRMLTSPAAGAAEERIPNVEVSLVLDISGSMRFTDSDGMMQIARLRPAAQNFISRMLQGERADLTTISIVPYAGQVNPGATVFDLIGGQRETITYQDSNGDPVVTLRDPQRSSCVEFNSTHFARTSIPQGWSFEQVPHFMRWAIDNPTMDWGWCPLEGNIAAGEASSAIQYLSADAADLNAYISRMRLHDGTGTHYGMLWGLWLLDPASRWVVEELANQGVVDAGLTGRPAPYDDPETLKVIVLMTDGNITDQFRPRFVDRTLSPLNETNPADIFLNHTRELDRQNNSNDCNGQGCRVTEASLSTNRNRFYEACDRARANGIIVFTIAFNTNDAGRQEMQRCASSTAHYYDVRGAALDSAFQSIAGTIQRLRLVQ
jgi:hypothetical protein